MKSSLPYILGVLVLAYCLTSWKSLTTLMTCFTTFGSGPLEAVWSKAVEEVTKNCKEPVKITEIEWQGEDSCADLFKITENWNKPMIMRNFRPANKHMDMGREYWNRYSDNTDILYRNQTQIYTWDGYGKTVRLQMKDVLDRMDNGERLYIDFNNELSNSNPEIVDHVGLNPTVCGREAYFGEMYLGYGHTENSTGTFSHSEIPDNIMIVLAGARTIHLNPSYCNAMIRPSISPNGHAYNDDRKIGKPLFRNQMESEYLPFLGCCDLHKAELSAGDAMYIPPWWIHDIINRPVDNEPSFLATISIRQIHLPLAFRAKWDYTVFTILNNLGDVVDHFFGRQVEVQKDTTLR